ncbi:MAG: DMT family transporter [Ilumatobacter sp.]
MTTTPPSAASAAAIESRDTTAGLVGAGIAVCAWSTGTILAKGIDMGGIAIGAYRFTMFSVLVAVYLAVRKTPLTWRAIRVSIWGGIALGADIALFFSAVKETSIVNATIIGSLQPILVGAVAAKFFGESIRAKDALWSLVALAGVFVIVTASADDEVTSRLGDLLALGALLSWSAYFIASKQSKGKITPTEFTAGTAIWTAMICIPLGFAFGQDMSLPSWTNLALLIVMIIVAGVVGHVLMNWSLVRIPLWVGSTFTLLIPVFSAILAYLFLDEEVLPIQAVAMAVVIAALAMIVRNQAAVTKANAANRQILESELETDAAPSKRAPSATRATSETEATGTDS